MGSLNRGSVVTRTLALLATTQEITGAELAQELGIDTGVAHGTLRRMATRTKAGVKRLYIIRWVEDHESARRYPRPVYALGDKPDRTKPKADQKEVKRRYYARLKSRTTMNSVFNLGLQWRAVPKENHVSRNI